MSTDRDWEKFGKKDPYFGVLTNERFKRENLTNDSREEFFNSGVVQINRIMNIIKIHINNNFKPNRALDFGCGTGRMLIPASKNVRQIIGIDVSESMLMECKLNCEKFGVANYELVKSDDNISSLEGKFDFIYSYIVFQHIPVERGIKILENLINRLEAGGICALYFNYAKSYCKSTYGMPTETKDKSKLKVKSYIKNLLGYFTRHDEPVMQMNCYNINQILYLLQCVGIKNTYIEYESHGGEWGVFLFFQKTNNYYTELLDIDCDDSQFIQVAYKAILKRTADPGGLAFYKQQFEQKIIDRRALIEIFNESEEGRDLVPNHSTGQE